MRSDCVSCGEHYPSTLYFAAPGVCKTCHAAGRAGDAVAAEHATHDDVSLLLTRRFWLSTGGWVFLVGSCLLALAELVFGAAGASLLVDGPGDESGGGFLLLAIFNAFIVLLIGLPVSAAFFTLRAIDDRLTAALGPDTA